MCPPSRLSHDYPWLNPVGDFNGHDFNRDNPLLEDRLKRHSVALLGSFYLQSAGCRSALCLFADFIRCVNIPVRKAKKVIISFSGKEKNELGQTLSVRPAGFAPPIVV